MSPASIAFAACVLLVAAPAAGQAPTAPPIAITNINLIRMRGDVIEPRSAVVVQDGRIRAAGRMNDVRIPENATVIDGAGGYLLPGLTDAHVHLATDMPWASVRRNFGDAPLFLAHGVTSVVNLRGSPEQLEWRRRIERGEWLAPTIYTSGEFIDEPRVITADDVTREVDAQRRAGVDLLKFHPVWTPQDGYLTTTGLSADAYRGLVAAARTANLPLVGHAPGEAGLDELLDARQTVAHMGILSNAYFLPVASHRRRLLGAATALVVLMLASAVTVGAALAARRRGRVRPRSRLESMTGLLVVLTLVAGGIAAAFLPGGPWFDSSALRIAFSAAAAAAGAAAVNLALQLKQHVSGRGPIGLAAGVVVSAAALFVGLTLALAIPVAWRRYRLGHRAAGRAAPAGECFGSDDARQLRPVRTGPAPFSRRRGPRVPRACHARKLAPRAASGCQRLRLRPVHARRDQRTAPRRSASHRRHRRIRAHARDPRQFVAS